MTSLTCPGLSGVLEYGGKMCTLAGVRSGCFAECLRKPGPFGASLGVARPLFDGDTAAFVAARPESADQCFNHVKKCGACGKVCAASIANCNSCGASLAETPTSQSNNVFVGFIHGVARGPFPFKISTRLETADTLVFDDPLACTPAHLCAIPTKVYVPTGLELFASPAQGAALLRRLEASAWEAMRTQFLSDSAWRASTFAGSPTDEELRASVAAGLNVPPSQFQLHLQYILPPLLPQQFKMYRAGVHFTYERFLPLNWLLASLDALASQNVSLPGLTDAPQLIRRVEELAPECSYAEAHAALYASVADSQQRHANWAPQCFEYLVDDATDTVVAALDATGAIVALDASAQAPTAQALFDADKKALQQYAKPAGAYYTHAKLDKLPTLA